MSADAELMTAIGFTLQDLDANRHRLLSPHQQQLLKNAQASWHSFSMLIKIAGTISVIVAILEGIRIDDTIASRIGIVVLICVVAAALLIYCRYASMRYKNDLAEGIAASVEGEVKLTQDLSRTTLIAYKIQIDQMQFTVSGSIWSAFENGQEYRLYFLPHSRTLLSAELRL